jgi:hypothetical protein
MGGLPDHLVLGQGIGRTELPSHVAIGKLQEPSGYRAYGTGTHRSVAEANAYANR